MIIIEICPKCQSEDFFRLNGCDYLCGTCGRISYKEAQKLARNLIRKYQNILSGLHYGYFFHVLASWPR